MHVVSVGVNHGTISALLSTGHDVTILYETRQQGRMAAWRDKVRHWSAVESYQAVEVLWSALHQTGAVQTGIDSVVAATEDGVLSAAVLGQLLGARSLDPQVALRCRDKVLQKEAWRFAGVPTANAMVIPDVNELDGHLDTFLDAAGITWPIIVKPPSGGGGRNVFCVRDEHHFRRTVAELQRSDPSQRRIMIESRNRGHEWHLDGVVKNGSVEKIMVSRYLQPLINTKQGRPTATIGFPPRLYPRLYRYAREFADKALLALGLHDSVFHFEVFGEAYSFVAGELGARPGGNMIGSVMKLTTGVDIWAELAYLGTGDEAPHGFSEPPDGFVYGYTHLPPNSNKINHVTESDIRSLPGVIEVEMVVQPGEVMPDMSASTSTRLGIAMVRARSVATCRSMLMEIASVVREINARGCQTHS
jgi:biotin carboxylase